VVALPAPGEQRPGRARTLIDDPYTGVVRRSVLDSGVRVLTGAMPGTRAVTLGVAVPVGSRDERGRYAGASHFLEHLLFKGTKKRSALEISASIESVGGDLNAFTGKEYTCFYARVRDQDAALALDVLLDMVVDSIITAADVDLERGVVLEEIAMVEDDPAGCAAEDFAELALQGSPLAAPIIGTVDSITAMSRADVRRHYRSWYRPQTLAVVAAGAVDHQAVVRAARKALAGWEAAPTDVRGRRPDAPASVTLDKTPDAAEAKSVAVRTRDTEQVNLVTGVDGLARNDERRYTLAVLNAVLGGGMSSRLFQSVREERGLAYSVHSFVNSYSDRGVVGVYAGCSPARLTDTLAVIDEVLQEVASHGLTAAELERGRGQIRGSMVLAQEEGSARMTSLAEAELITGKVRSLDEMLAAVDKVTADDVADLAAQLWQQPRRTAVVGPVGDDAVAGLEDR